MMTFGSLFAGIGGIDLGLERAGMVCKWQVEIDERCRRVLDKHWPNVPKHRDVRLVSAWNLEAVDVIAGGFPCQPHSQAGKRRASADERDLWPEFRRLIHELRPGWVLAENVPGLLSSDAGRFFGGVLRDLAQLRYDAEWSLLSACTLGAPHTRERVFLMAYSREVAGLGWRQRKGSRTSVEGLCAPIRGAHNVEAHRFDQISGWWAAQPSVGRVADGVSARMDRIGLIGNAVVPQVAEFIGRCILEFEAAQTERKAA